MVIYTIVRYEKDDSPFGSTPNTLYAYREKEQAEAEKKRLDQELVALKEKSEQVNNEVNRLMVTSHKYRSRDEFHVREKWRRQVGTALGVTAGDFYLAAMVDSYEVEEIELRE